MRGPCVSSLDCSRAQPIMPSWVATIVMAAPPRKRRRSIRVISAPPRVGAPCACFLAQTRSKPSLCGSPRLSYLRLLQSLLGGRGKSVVGSYAKRGAAHGKERDHANLHNYHQEVTADR